MKQRVKRIPAFLQMSTVECGAVCLGMVLAYYHRFVPREIMRADCGVTRDGCSAKDILRTARFHGLNASAVKTTVGALRRRKDFPIILHWDYSHFVVLCGFRNSAAVINDPAHGRMTVSEEEFENLFTGVAILLEPSDSFRPTEKTKDGSGWLNGSLREMRPLLIAIAVLGLLIAVLQLPQSLFYRFFADNILLRGTDARLGRLLIVMAATAMLSLFVRWLQVCCIARMTEKHTYSCSEAFVSRLLHLPESFYAQRFAGDLIYRLTGIESLGLFRYAALIPTVIDLIMSVIYLAVMLVYHVPLALVGLAFAIINLLLIVAENRRNESFSAKVERDRGRVSGAAMSVISTIESLKACGAEEGTYRRISGLYALRTRSKLEFRQQTDKYSALLRIFSGLADGVILFLGIYFIFRGESTIGMLMAFQGLLQQTLLPARALAGSVEGLTLAKSDTRRIDDVMQYPMRDAETVSDCGAAPALRGEIRLEHITFRYSRFSGAVLNDVSISVPAGSSVVITGSSGCGKTTVCQLISGQYKPESGEIYFDGVPAAQVTRASLIRSLAAVNQRICLFRGTVRDNLTLWDRTVSEEALIRACRDAEIYDTVMRQERGFDFVMSENGRNFSGGQRQQLEIARALVKEPTVLILDEATSALDPITEKKIMDNIRARGITCLIVAHRLSAIRDADSIIVLSEGVIAEEGTHAQLAAAGGCYTELLQ